MSANYTLTGTFQQLTGASDTVSQVVIQLCNFGNTQPKATGILITTGPLTVTCTAGSFSVTLWGNDQITPAGTYYVIRILTSSGQRVSELSYSLTGGGTHDLSALTPIS